MQLLKILNPENVSELEATHYPVRKAARAVVVDAEGNIALLHVTNENYYKLPGGGIEESEDRHLALRRECQEEIGCDVEVVGELGMIVEYRKFCTLKQISYCYLAKVKGEKGTPNFTAEEITEGFEQLWLPYDEALVRLSENNAINLEGRAYIVPRDFTFLQYAAALKNDGMVAPILSQ